MTVRSLIEQHLPDFSASDTRVARLILERYPVSALGGIEDLARHSEVSAPTVTRFVKRLGFKKFTDFQRAIRLEVQETEVSPLALLKKHQNKPAEDSNTDHRMMDFLAGAMEKVLDEPTQRSLDKAAKIISDDKARIYLLGGRWSSILAQYAAYQLITLRGEVHIFAPQVSGVLEDRIADLTRKDVLIAFDFRRYQSETIAFCQTVKEFGVRIVLFTDLDLSPIADIADVVIPVTVETTTPLDTLAVALATTDALFTRIVKTLGTQVLERMAMLEGLRRKASDPNMH
ncbi:MAG: MurR/RpiR family transcriptional regulator [Rhizobiaceae bacterium]